MTHTLTQLTLLSLFLVVRATALGTQPFKPVVTGEINTDPIKELDHLEPFHGKVPLPEDYYLAQYFEAPALADQANYLIVLRTKDGRYLVRLSKTAHDKFPTEAPTPDKEIEIPESLASVIYDLWVNALLEVRYERRQHGGLDGELYYFSTFVTSLGWMHGYTWSPGGDLPPVWMMEAGKKLVAFAHDEKRSATAIEGELTVLRNKLFRYIKAHGKH